MNNAETQPNQIIEGKMSNKRLSRVVVAGSLGISAAAIGFCAYTVNGYRSQNTPEFTPTPITATPKKEDRALWPTNFIIETPTIPPTETPISTQTPKPTPTILATSTPETPRILESKNSDPTPTKESITKKDNPFLVNRVDLGDELTQAEINLFDLDARKINFLIFNTQSKYDQFEQFKGHLLVFLDDQGLLFLNIHDGFNPKTKELLEAEKLRIFIEGDFQSPLPLEERMANLKKTEGKVISFKQADNSSSFVIRSAKRTNQNETSKPELVDNMNKLFGQNIDPKKSIVMMTCSRPIPGETGDFPGRYFFLLEAYPQAEIQTQNTRSFRVKEDPWKNTFMKNGINFARQDLPITYLFPGEGTPVKLCNLLLSKSNQEIFYQMAGGYSLLYEDRYGVSVLGIHSGKNPKNGSDLEAELLRHNIEGDLYSPLPIDARIENLKKIQGQSLKLNQNGETKSFMIKKAVRLNEKEVKVVDPMLLSDVFKTDIDPNNSFILMICSRSTADESTSDLYPGRLLFLVVPQ